MSRKIVRTTCIVCGNSYKNSHRFFGLPKNEEMKKRWLVLLKCEDILDHEPRFLHNNARVCDKHFQEWAFSSSLKDRLIHGALPNSDPPPVYPLFPPKSHEEEKKPQYRILKLSKAHIEELKKQQGKIIWNRTDQTSRLSISKENGHGEQPSSLTSVDGNCDQPSSPSIDGNCDQPSSPASVVGNCDQPSSSVSIDGNCDQPSLQVSKDGNCKQPVFSFSVIRHSTPPSSSPKSSSLTGKVKPNKKVFTKKAQHDRSDLYQLISTQRKEIRNQRTIISRMKKKMEALRNENLNFQKTVMDKLNTERYGFLKSLIKQLGTKKGGGRGMRWSEKDKEFANACYVLSPKVYKMLRFKLGFPSQTTLKRIGAGESRKAANQVSDEPLRVVDQMSDESNEAVNRTSESNIEINKMLDESNESVIQMSESGEALEVDESTIAVNQLMGQGQKLQVNESTGAFFRFIESMESMNESKVREVVEIIESVP